MVLAITASLASLIIGLGFSRAGTVLYFLLRTAPISMAA
jgi:hypothetical protein